VPDADVPKRARLPQKCGVEAELWTDYYMELHIIRNMRRFPA
jgi:hypothetical protein